MNLMSKKKPSENHACVYKSVITIKVVEYL